MSIPRSGKCFLFKSTQFKLQHNWNFEFSVDYIIFKSSNFIIYTFILVLVDVGSSVELESVQLHPFELGSVQLHWFEVHSVGMKVKLAKLELLKTM